MKKKYVTVELEFAEFNTDAIMGSTPLIGGGSSDIIDDFGELSSSVL